MSKVLLTRPKKDGLKTLLTLKKSFIQSLCLPLIELLFSTDFLYSWISPKNSDTFPFFIIRRRSTNLSSKKAS